MTRACGGQRHIAAYRRTRRQILQYAPTCADHAFPRARDLVATLLDTAERSVYWICQPHFPIVIGGGKSPCA
jgi:hypothetical protein